MSEDTDIANLHSAERQTGDTTFAAICLAFSLFLLTQMTSQTTWATGQPFAAQPGFWPRIAVIGMAVFSALNLVFSLRDRRTAERLTGLGEEILVWVRSLEFAGWFMVYVFAAPIIGYLPATVLFSVFLSIRVGYRSPMALAMSASVALATVLLFKSFLQVKIPGGAIYEYLPETLRNFFILYL